MTDPTQQQKRGEALAALRFAFPKTIPIMAGFLFLGMTYGILMNTSGFNFLYPLFSSLLVFAGSMEFLIPGILLGPYDPLGAFGLALVVNSRHLFYGISMLDKYRDTGWKKYYLVYGMCDESFSINCSMEVPEGIDRGWAMFFTTLLNQIYWVAGATIGGLAGSLLTFDTGGLDFAMTALFVVIFLDQWLKEKDHSSSLIGLALSVLALLIFGADAFILPAMAAILAVLLIKGMREEAA